MKMIDENNNKDNVTQEISNPEVLGSNTAQKISLKKRAKKSKAPKKSQSSTMKNWIKEIKRILWPKSAKSWRWFGITIAFIVLLAIFCFLITLAFSGLWNAVGIKA